MNNKGFTIIELISTIIILALVLGIGSYSVISLVGKTRERHYESLVISIKDAVETYVIECKYASDDENDINCNMNPITLGKLVEYGCLTGNGKNDTDVYTIVNPRDNKSIADCEVSYTYNNGNINVTPVVSSNDSCPTAY